GVPEAVRFGEALRGLARARTLGDGEREAHLHHPVALAIAVRAQQLWFRRVHGAINIVTRRNRVNLAASKLCMLVVVWSLWLGALVGATLKLASPHRSPFSWLLAGCVGALGGMVGVYAARFAGLTAAHPSSYYVAVALAAAGVVVLYAALSRWAHRRSAKHGRPTRPTLVF